MSDAKSVDDNENDDDDNDVDKPSRQAVKTIAHSQLKCRFTAQSCNATTNSLRQRQRTRTAMHRPCPGPAITSSLFTFFPLGLQPVDVNVIKDRFILLFWEFSIRKGNGAVEGAWVRAEGRSIRVRLSCVVHIRSLLRCHC